MKLINADYNINVLAEVKNFNEKFKDAAITEHERLLERFATEVEDEIIKEFEDNEGYLVIMTMDWGDADTLITLLETFKETTEKKIEGIEEKINKDIKNDWTEN